MNEDNKKILTEELSKMEKKLGLDENLLAEILGLEREHQWTTNRNLEDRLDDIIINSLKDTDFGTFLKQKISVESDKQEDVT